MKHHPIVGENQMKKDEVGSFGDRHPCSCDLDENGCLVIQDLNCKRHERFYHRQPNGE